MECLDAGYREISVQEWLRVWSDAYRADDEALYSDLIRKHASLSTSDFQKIGQWKEGVLGGDGSPNGRWKSNVASVAYDTWMEIASARPPCPDEGRVSEFLNEWSERKAMYRNRDGSVQEKKFGLSRTTTLLHFLSGAKYPIFDSRVERAVKGLIGQKVNRTKLGDYQQVVRPLVAEILRQCQTGDLRKVDRALFAYGAWLAREDKKKHC